MPTFISKLQYKNYEKGEFVNEEPRDARQTDELIRNFPWDSQSDAEVYYTSPSVTIQNDAGEYLKLGRYIGNRFVLYLYDQNQHLFELVVPTLSDARRVVDCFFIGTLDRDQFDRKSLVFGADKHFESQVFVYTFRLWTWTFCMFILGMLAFFLLIMLTLTLKKFAWQEVVVFAVFATMCASGFYLLINHYRTSSHVYLELPRGGDTFYYGPNEAEAAKYSKLNIIKINNSYSRSSRSSRLGVCEIRFKDGSKIRISSFVVDGYVLDDKFPGIEIDHPVNLYPLV